MNDQIVPRPEVGSQRTSVERHPGHIGRGGIRHVPHAAQTCTSSSPRAVPAQNSAAVGSARSGSRKPVSMLIVACSLGSARGSRASEADRSPAPSSHARSARRGAPVRPKLTAHLLHHGSFVKRIALVGTPSPLVTRDTSAFSTWLVDVPRIWRTPSRTRLKPCTYASDIPPPDVFVGSRPFGHSR